MTVSAASRRIANGKRTGAVKIILFLFHYYCKNIQLDIIKMQDSDYGTIRTPGPIAAHH
jgi:hypothetical protein